MRHEMRIWVLILAFLPTAIAARDDLEKDCHTIPFHPLFSFDRVIPLTFPGDWSQISTESHDTNHFDFQPLENIKFIPTKRDNRWESYNLTDLINSRSIEDIVDVIVYVPHTTINRLPSWLDAWRKQISTFHVVLLIDINTIFELDSVFTAPVWLNYDLYTRNDVNIETDRNLEILFRDRDDLSMLSFGILASSKEIVVVLSIDLYPLVDLKNGNTTSYNLIEEHIVNLLTPTLPESYDKDKETLEDQDFILDRKCLLTAVSIGRTVSSEEEAEFVLSKWDTISTFHLEKSWISSLTSFTLNQHLLELTMKNVAFHRKIIGPILYLGDLLSSDSELVPRERWRGLGERLAGWLLGVLISKSGLGIKRGFPYAVTVEERNRDVMITEVTGELEASQSELLNRVKGELLHLTSVMNSPESIPLAIFEIAMQLQEALAAEYPIIEEYYHVMVNWIDLWNDRNGGNYGRVDCQNPHEVFSTNEESMQCLVHFTPKMSRSSLTARNVLVADKDKESSSLLQSTCAVMTMVRNEATMLPVWIRYYRRFVPLEDLWILDHYSTDNSTHVEKIPSGIHIIKLRGDAAFSPHHFLNRKVEAFQQRLLSLGYPCVLFTEVDEFVFPDPQIEVYSGGNLTVYLQDFLLDDQVDTIVTNGFDVCHVSQGKYIEDPLNFSEGLLGQRQVWRESFLFSKPLLTKVPFRFLPGFHRGIHPDLAKVLVDPELFLAHFHYGDRDFCMKREEYKYLSAKQLGKESEKHLGIVNLSRTIDNISQALHYLCIFAWLYIDEHLTIQAPMNDPFQDGKQFSLIPEVIRQQIYI